ncbi:MAG: formate--tetrahydrofolate ligase [Myxococcota bacterium]
MAKISAKIPAKISAIAEKIGLDPEQLIPYGHDKAKVPLSVLSSEKKGKGRLVLVTAITPTPAGEGKTTTTIGLGQALDQAGERVCVALREPSMGPCFGIKGGGTGGGQSRLVPSDEINMHFTGDLHAVTAAHNLLAAMVDNHLHFDQTPRLDVRRVWWKRVLDVNDRALRGAMVGLGGRSQGVPRETGFDITAASELMAILCLSQDAADLRRRLSDVIVGFTRDSRPVTAGDLGAVGAMMAIMKEAIKPNLVQTVEGTPAFVHGGPFANIAHGCNSVLATRMAMHHGDWALTEAGFGADLGAEKFFNIKCQSAGLSPSLVVLVATARALKMHGGVALKDLNTAAPDSVAAGMPNLLKHLENLQGFSVPVVVAINRFPTDTDEELAVIARTLAERDVPVAMCTHFQDGGAGAAKLAALVKAHALPEVPELNPTYRWSMSPEEKIEAVARTIYGASGVDFSPQARVMLRFAGKLGLADAPICMAKTHRSLSDNPKRLGRPEDFSITVQSVEINGGARMIVALTGDIVRMPGLPKKPAALRFDVVDGEIVGLS